MKIRSTQVELMLEAAHEIYRESIEQLYHDYRLGSIIYLPYHDDIHTDEVFNSATQIAEKAHQNGRIPRESIPLIQIAAAKHDSYYRPDTPGINEERSADLAIASMKKYTCFENYHYETVGRLIMATSVSSYYPKLVQNVSDDKYDEKILDDADISSFGMPEMRFKRSALAYLKELKLYKNQRSMQYLEGEIVLLENHTWHTEEAAELFPHKDSNIHAVSRWQTAYAVQ